MVRSDPVASPDPRRDRGPGLARRLAAAFYVLLLLLAVLAVGTACWLPFTGGQAVRPHDPFYAAFLLALSFGFYGWFWVHGGQTLGMRAWRLRLRTGTGEALSWRHAGLRFATAWLSLAVFGVGFLWSAFSPLGESWHDRLSGTRVDWV
ncbi:MAG: RDD family protein [Methylococcaceae bacterium]|nr:RDD family protein [Methylococcaceae bacterium]